MQRFSHSIIMAGCGHMGGAMLHRWVDCGLNPAQVTVVRPSGAPVVSEVNVQRDTAELAAPDILILGFKPQQLADAAPAYAALAGPDTLVLSLLAGVEAASLRKHFPNAGAMICAMPNLPVAVGQGVVLLAAEADAPQSAISVAEALLAPLGLVHRMAEDEDFNVLTALTGCSPAYLYAFTQSTADAAMALGVRDHVALRLAQAAVYGSAVYALSQPKVTPADNIAAVAGKGGMTQKGLDVLAKDTTFTRLMIDTLAAAAERGRELAKS
jgi:pyrroline-5-carboxylate reductase